MNTKNAYYPFGHIVFSESPHWAYYRFDWEPPTRYADELMFKVRECAQILTGELLAEDFDEDEDEEEVVVLYDAGCAVMRAVASLWAAAGEVRRRGVPGLKALFSQSLSQARPVVQQ